MNILMLTPYLPYPLLSGGQIRTFNLLKNLKDKHSITLFSLIKSADRPYLEALKPYCHKLKVFRRSDKPFTPQNMLKTGLSTYPLVVIRNLVPETAQAVKQELKSRPYDLIHAETFYMMPNLPRTTIPIILVEQTIEYLGYQSYAQNSRRWYLKPFFSLDIAKIKHLEKHYWRTCSRLITMSQSDQEFIQTECPDIKHIDVVANGVDIPFFTAVPKKLPAVPTILFVGTFSWLPNRQATIWLVEHIWPLVKQRLLKARLHIVGFKPTAKILAYNQLPDVTVNGNVQDIRQAYATAHVLVAPVNWGKGTRYKILESMATQTPVVATPLAVEGIAGLVPGEHVLVADTTQALAAQTLKVLTQPHLQQRLAKASYRLVTQHYDWAAISQDLDRIYHKLGQNL
ncbi:hypothetical protein A2W24_05760 [Microgenomates group bacterium RBG_16_45_19]|nr:MAG: hypothetical protein A2W24_05760 [Microgenomates group bacterium RBG_16_45_19]